MSKEIVKAESQKKLNLLQKLHHIQRVVNGLKADKSSHNFSYTTGEKILSEIKPLMNELGLLLEPSVTQITTERQDYKTSRGEKSENTVVLNMIMTWVDVYSGEQRPIMWGAIGQNDWDKGFGSALSYSERYFLLKYFHISTDQDDIDNLEVRRYLEESLSVAVSEDELKEIWGKLDAQQQKRMQKQFTERKQFLMTKKKSSKTDVSEGL